LLLNELLLTVINNIHNYRLTFGEGFIDKDTVILSLESKSESNNNNDGDNNICGILFYLIIKAVALPHYNS
jgi:hypothetical protein